MSHGPPEAEVVALAHAIRQADAPAKLQADVKAFLREAGVEGEDLEEMASLGAQRIEAYRALVHNRIRNTIDDFIPRSADRLGLARLEADVTAFMDERAMQSPYLRDIPNEFVYWALPRWEEDPEVPAYIPDLARHELLRLDVKNSPKGGESATEEKIDLEKPIVVEGSAVVMRYAYAVHKLPKARTDRTQPEQTETCLIAFRGPDQKTHYIDCKLWVAALIERLIEGKTLKESLFGALESVGMELDDDILSRTAVVLADFSDQGLLLGGRA